MHKVSVNEGEENRADDNGEFISPFAAAAGDDSSESEFLDKGGNGRGVKQFGHDLNNAV